MSKYIDFHTHQLLNTDHIQIINSQTEEKDGYEFYSLGNHPWLITSQPMDEALITHTAQDPNCIAVGESGLDKVIDIPLEAQLEIFKKDIAIAKKLRKPIIVHCVRAYQECLALLQGVTAIFHGYNKNITLAQQIVNQGHYLSFGHALLNKTDTQEAFAALPIDKCLLETDNSTFSIEEIYNYAAKIRKIDLEELILQQHKNFEQLFNIKL